jgi:hypothetical protein
VATAAEVTHGECWWFGGRWEGWVAAVAQAAGGGGWGEGWGDTVTTKA